MADLIAKRLLTSMIVSAVLSSFYAHGEAVDTTLAKVTIVVDGMMKSKSGAT